MKVYGTIIVFMFLLVGCKSDKKDFVKCDVVRTVGSFPKEIELPRARKLPVPLVGCVDVFHADSLLICKMLHGEKFWKIVSLNSLRPLGNFIRKGRGKDEMGDLPSSEVVTADDGFLLCDLYDSTSKTWYQCNLTKSLENKEIFFQRRKRLKDDISNIVSLPDSSFFLVKYFLFRGFKRSILSRMGKEREVNPGNLNSILADGEINVLSASRVVNRKKGLVAEAMLRLGQINLYSLESGKGLTLSMGKGLTSVSEVEGMSKRKCRKYFGGMYATEDLFGALFYDMSLEDFNEGNVQRSEILFFDWQGNPLLRVRLPFLAVSFFIYKDCLYAFSDSGSGEGIYKYSLNGILGL